MAEWFADGRVIDGIIAFMLLELLIVILVRKRASLPFAVNLGAGAALLLALRAALCGLGWQRIALFLLLAFAFHLWELALFWSARRIG